FRAEIAPVLLTLERWLRRRIPNPLDREELMDDIAVIMWRKCPIHVVRPEELTAYAFTAFKHEVARAWDRGRRHKLAPLPGDVIAANQPSPHERAVSSELTALVAAALDGLPAADRDILTLRDLGGLSFSAIAIRLDINPEAARQRYRRALVRL